MQIMRDMSGLREPEEEDRKVRMEKLSEKISDVLLTPFAAIIREMGHIIFSLSQPLTTFPVSALVFDRKPLILPSASDRATKETFLPMAGVEAISISKMFSTWVSSSFILVFNAYKANSSIAY